MRDDEVLDGRLAERDINGRRIRQTARSFVISRGEQLVCTPGRDAGYIRELTTAFEALDRREIAHAS